MSNYHLPHKGHLPIVGAPQPSRPIMGPRRGPPMEPTPTSMPIPTAPWRVQAAAPTDGDVSLLAQPKRPWIPPNPPSPRPPQAREEKKGEKKGMKEERQSQKKGPKLGYKKKGKDKSAQDTMGKNPQQVLQPKKGYPDQPRIKPQRESEQDEKETRQRTFPDKTAIATHTSEYWK